jgi:2-polyprenyl-6-methoxyphenol hydroxylase-like FAD-dependent oxidoreductase
LTDNENEGHDRERHDCDALIVGAGAIGPVLALLLAQQRPQVTVVERW